MTAYGQLGEITDAQWDAVAARFDLGAVRRATALQQGLFGRNVELETDTGLWVFRGAHAAEVFGRERFNARHIDQRSALGAPWPYYVDDSCESFDWAYSVMRHVGGEIVSFDQDRDWVGVAAALGRAAAELHAVTFDRHGAWIPATDDLAGFDGSQREWFDARLAGWIFRTAAHEPLDADSERWLLDAAAAANVDGYEPTLVHHDFTIGNTRFGFGGGCDVVGVFDLQECYAGDPDEDLARSLWQFVRKGPAVGRAFIEAYRDRRPARPGERDRLYAYVVADLVVIWEFGRRDGRDWFGEAETFRAWAEPMADAALG